MWKPINGPWTPQDCWKTAKIARGGDGDLSERLFYYSE